VSAVSYLTISVKTTYCCPMVHKSQVAMATKFCAVASNVCKSSVWNLPHGTLLAPKILKWLFLCVWKISTAGSILDRVKSFSSCPKRPNWLWSPPCLMYNAFRVPPKCGAHYLPTFSADVANELVLYLPPPPRLTHACHGLVFTLTATT